MSLMPEPGRFSLHHEASLPHTSSRGRRSCVCIGVARNDRNGMGRCKRDCSRPAGSGDGASVAVTACKRNGGCKKCWRLERLYLGGRRVSIVVTFKTRYRGFLCILNRLILRDAEQNTRTAFLRRRRSIWPNP